MIFNEDTNKFINGLIVVGSFVTTITCIALIIYHGTEQVDNLRNVLILGFTGFLSIILMSYSIDIMIKEKQTK